MNSQYRCRMSQAPGHAGRAQRLEPAENGGAGRRLAAVEGEAFASFRRARCRSWRPDGTCRRNGARLIGGGARHVGGGSERSSDRLADEMEGSTAPARNIACRIVASPYPNRVPGGIKAQSNRRKFGRFDDVGGCRIDPFGEARRKYRGFSCMAVASRPPTGEYRPGSVYHRLWRITPLPRSAHQPE